MSAEPETTSEEPEKTLLADAISYPLRGNGRMMLVIGSVLLGLLTLGSIAPLLGFVAILATWLYFTAFYLDIITTTAAGSDESPDFPDVTDLYGDIVQPVLRSALAWICAFLPLTVVLARPDGDGTATALLLAGAWAAYYFPMAITNVAMECDMVSALPHRVIPDTLRAMPGYLILTGLLAAVVIAGNVAAELSLEIPLLGGLIGSGVTLYFLMMQARLAGMFHRRRLEAEAEAEAAEEQRRLEEARNSAALADHAGPGIL